MNSSVTLEIGAIILAAGQSTRAGVLNKLLADGGGVCMLSHVVAMVGISSIQNVVIVTGHEHEVVERKVRSELPVDNRLQKSLQIVRNINYANGVSSSLQCGLEALGRMDAALVCLGDMPNVSSRTVDKLISSFKLEPTIDAVIPTFNNKRGNPVLISSSIFSRVAKLQGDTGAKHLLQADDVVVSKVAVDDAAVLQDYDTQSSILTLKP